ncbi:bactericidal permeability-increasing protein-like [Oscarella lobularis]|uniref:bactericidal permeability-increasing protein-like n=1 Tax=Oscarella lobularis TaxID=121494 RepID=UPI003314290E
MVRATFLLAFALFCSVSAPNPGFRTEITQKGLDYVRQIGIPILEEKLKSIDIPKVTGEADSPIGTVSYYAENLVGSHLVIPSSALTVVPNVGLEIAAKEISMLVTGKWHYRRNGWPHIEGTGTFDVTVSDVSLSIIVIVGADASGQPNVSSKSCEFNIGHMSIDFHGTGSWFYNLFSNVISNDVKGVIEKSVCNLATKEISVEANAALSTLPIVEKVSSFSEINFELISAPVFNESYLQTFHKGEFLYVPHPVQVPYQPTSLPPASPSSRMMTIWLTDYIANSAGFVYQDANVLHLNVTQNMLPSNLPIQLNTSSFKYFLPTLYEKYPNLPMQLFVNATAPPYLNISKSSVNLTFPGEVTVFVADNGIIINTFTLGIIMHGTVHIALRQNGTKEIIYGNATYLKSDITLLHSNIGHIDVTKLESAVNALCLLVAVPYLNVKYGAPGIQIPSIDGASFVDPVITQGQDYVRIDTDIHYDSSLKKSGFVQLKSSEESPLDI